jgi:hypothetical protein
VVCESHAGHEDLKTGQRLGTLELFKPPTTQDAPMTACHTAQHTASSSALERLLDLITDREKALRPVDDYRAFEDGLHALMAEVERDLLAAELARLDLDAPELLIDGVLHKQVSRDFGAYMTCAGQVRVERSLYRASRDERAVSPMKYRAGIVEGWWTPSAALLAMWAVAHLTPKEAAEFFGRLGGMQPSRSSLDTLPRELNPRWEDQRTRFEESIRVGETVPAGAVSVAASLDGVLVPMKDGKRQQKKARARKDGKKGGGPAGYKEAACATLAFYDADGERIGATRYLGRMPESKKATLKAMLEDELVAVLDQRPDLTCVGLADGAKDNWSFLVKLLPPGSVEALDFYHASEHLKEALDHAHGKGSARSSSEYERLKVLLRDEHGGVNKVINALAYQHRKHPRRKKLACELKYFRTNRHRMDYAGLKARGLPIGSGVVEAANKTLVTVRMKRSGARWRTAGGQGVLTFRALAKTQRFDRAWDLLIDTYKFPVALPDNVLSFKPRSQSSLPQEPSV